MTRLARIVQEALDDLVWTADIDDDEAAGECHVATHALIDGQPCDIFIDTDEGLDALSVFIYLPFCVKPGQYAEACQLVNAINVAVRHAHLEILQDSGRVRLVVSANVEGASPTGLFLVRMLQCGDHILCHWLGALAAVAVTGRPAAEVLAAIAPPAADEAPAEDGVDRPVSAPIMGAPVNRTLH